MHLTLPGRIAALLAVLAVPCAFASEPLQVTLTADEFDGICDAHCSLRDAIEAANQAAEPQHIVLAAGDYLLSRPSLPDENGFAGDEDDNRDGDFDVRAALTIQGRGDLRTRIIGQADSRIFEVLPGANLSLLRLSLEGGRTARTGGAIENHGELLLRQVRLNDNSAITPHPEGDPPSEGEGFIWGQGGAIANYGNLLVYASTFSNNKSQTLDWNDNLGRGGAIFNMGELLVRDSRFDGNSADEQADRGHGGAIYTRGPADIARSLFSHNKHGESGSGGAIFNTEQGVLKLSNSTLTGNVGALYNGYEDFPGTVLALASLFNVTIAESVGSGLSNTGDILLRNSLIVANYDPMDPDTPHDCGTSGASARFRASGLLTSSPLSSCQADLHETPERIFSHLLHPLADNGGASETYALRSGSLALDAGVGSCTGHDQRRQPRPLDGNGDNVAVCDLGAYEKSQP